MTRPVRPSLTSKKINFVNRQRRIYIFVFTEGYTKRGYNYETYVLFIKSTSHNSFPQLHQVHIFCTFRKHPCTSGSLLWWRPRVVLHPSHRHTLDSWTHRWLGKYHYQLSVCNGCLASFHQKSRMGGGVSFFSRFSLRWSSQTSDWPKFRPWVISQSPVL